MGTSESSPSILLTLTLAAIGAALSPPGYAGTTDRTFAPKGFDFVLHLPRDWVRVKPYGGHDFVAEGGGPGNSANVGVSVSRGWPRMTFDEFAAFVWREHQEDLLKGDELTKRIVNLPGGRAEAIYFDVHRESTDGKVRRYRGIRYFFFVERRVYQFAYAAAPSDFGRFRTVFERSAMTIRFR